MDRLFHVLALGQDEIFDLRGIGDEGVGSADAADRGIEVFEKLVRDACGELHHDAIQRGFPEFLTLMKRDDIYAAE